MAKVHTTKGLVDRDKLAVVDIVTDEDNARVIATEWRDETGEMVRRDVHVAILVGQSLAGEAAELV